jgi:CysZ protein
METQPNVTASARYQPLSGAMNMMFGNGKLLTLSLALFMATALFTWIGYSWAVNTIDNASAGFTSVAPATDTVWGWVKYSAWVVGSWLLLLISRLVAFSLSFLVAYSLTAPGYALLSAGAERLIAGERFEADAAFTLAGVFRDILEGLKIALFGLVVTLAVIFVSTLPVLGQLIAVFLYTFYSTLMFIDYSASRRRWSLGKKLLWLRRHGGLALRLGLLPALLGMIPLINIFVVALFFPLLTIHATINFSATQLAEPPAVSRKGDPNG